MRAKLSIQCLQYRETTAARDPANIYIVFPPPPLSVRPLATVAVGNCDNEVTLGHTTMLLPSQVQMSIDIGMLQYVLGEEWVFFGDYFFWREIDNGCSCCTSYGYRLGRKHWPYPVSSRDICGENLLLRTRCKWPDHIRISLQRKKNVFGPLRVLRGRCLTKNWVDQFEKCTLCFGPLRGHCLTKNWVDQFEKCTFCFGPLRGHCLTKHWVDQFEKCTFCFGPLRGRCLTKHWVDQFEKCTFCFGPLRGRCLTKHWVDQFEQCTFCFGPLRGRCLTKNWVDQFEQCTFCFGPLRGRCLTKHWVDQFEKCTFCSGFSLTIADICVN